jgi:hypothetical protein
VGGLFRGLIVLMAARAMFDIRVTLPFDHDARIVLSFRPAVVARRVAVASVFGTGRVPALWRTAWQFTTRAFGWPEGAIPRACCENGAFED